VLIGGSGRDAASYAFAASGVLVNLARAGEQQNTFGAGLDVLAGIEDLIGSTHQDFLFGDDGDNRLTAGAGDDLLIGGAGDDVIYPSGSPPEGPGSLAPRRADEDSGPSADSFAFAAFGARGASFTAEAPALRPVSSGASAAPFNVVLADEEGSGPDVIRFGPGWGHDVVHGYVVGGDRLDFSRTTADDVLDFDVEDVAAGVLIALADNSVLLSGVFAEQLTDESFIL
jgi:Ca2+-binding RTX toxin-like protein